MEPGPSKLDVLRGEMSQIPLGELKEMQEKLGLKAFNKIMLATKGKGGPDSKKGPETVYSRENKNRPTEMSARRPVPKTSSVPKDRTVRDPRFDDLSGEFNERIFNTTYGFLKDVKFRDKKKLEKMMSKTKDKEKKTQMKMLLNRMEQQELAEQRKAKRLEMEREWKKKEREQVKEGKKPYFLKKSEKQALLNEEYRKELEQSGKLQKYLKRKTKKLALKEKRTKTWTTQDL